MMHEPEKSDRFVVATKPANKPGRPGAESVERRGRAEEQFALSLGTRENAAVAPRGAATIARDWLDAMNAHQAPRLRAMLADDFAWEAGAAPQRGPDDAVNTWCAWFDRLPDLVFEPLHELGHEAWAIHLLRLHATQRVAPSAVFTPRPGTEFAATRRIDLAGCAVFTVHADRITRLWTYWDESALRPTSPAHAHADF